MDSAVIIGVLPFCYESALVGKKFTVPSTPDHPNIREQDLASTVHSLIHRLGRNSRADTVICAVLSMECRCQILLQKQ